MKFGRCLHAHIDPLWADEYIDYDNLKESLRIKDPSAPWNRQKEILRSLEAEVDRVQSFLQPKLPILQDVVSTITERYQTMTSGTPTTDLVPARETEIAIEINSVMERLEQFSAVNQCIIRRIEAKLNLDYSLEETMSKSLIYIRPWLAYWPLIDNILSNSKELPSSSAVDAPSSAAQPDVQTGVSLNRNTPNESTNAQRSREILGRTALHYAALRGLKDSCVQVLEAGNPTMCLDPDSMGDSALALAVSSGNTALVRQFLDPLRQKKQQNLKPEDLFCQMLTLAIRCGHAQLAVEIIAMNTGLDRCDRFERTPLHIAVQYGQLGVVQELLVRVADGMVSVNAQEASRHWTPLIVACVYGYVDIARQLLRAGASVDQRDRRLWTAVDHAAYRGHMEIVKTLQEYSGSHCPGYPESGLEAEESSVPNGSADEPPTDLVEATDAAPADKPRETHVLLNLGSLDVFRRGEAILDLGPLAERVPRHKILENDLALVISTTGCSNTYRVRLPLLEDLDLKPFHFKSSDSSSCRVNFSIFRQSSPICTGVALLSHLMASLGPQRETVARDHTIPLLDTSSTYAGTLTFSFVVSRPLPEGVNQPPIWQRMRVPASTTVGAHRDVQVTKDLVPVIYHDFLVSETGTDAGMHALSFPQFMAISNDQAPQPEAEETKVPRLPWDERSRPRHGVRRRANSLRAPLDAATQTLFGRIKHTFEYSTYGIKGNTRSAHIHEPFLTLEDVMEKLPDEVCIDIELKYPMLSETADWKMDPMAMEINLYIDVILDSLFQLQRKLESRGRRPRSIFLSAFSAEACILLATKQQVYPVLLLNDSSLWPAGDPRALSLQTSVHFARRWGLAGVCIAAEPLVAAPGLIPFVRRDLGLYLGSYGSLNDEIKTAKIQANAGIDTIIVNNVRAVAKAIRGN